MAEIDEQDLLNITSRNNFAYFPHQQGHAPGTYRFGTEGNGTNIKFEVRLQIEGSNELGLSGLPKNCMPDYLEAVWIILHWHKHSFELIAPP